MDETKFSTEMISVVVDLFDRSDAETIEFESMGVKITRRVYNQTISNTGSYQNPNIQIINNIFSNINIDNRAIVVNIIEQMEDSGISGDELEEVKQKLHELRQEVEKDNPKWDKIKKSLLWGLEYGKDFFVQLLPLLLKLGENS